MPLMFFLLCLFGWKRRDDCHFLMVVSTMANGGKGKGQGLVHFTTSMGICFRVLGKMT